MPSTSWDPSRKATTPTSWLRPDNRAQQAAGRGGTRDSGRDGAWRSAFQARTAVRGIDASGGVWALEETDKPACSPEGESISGIDCRLDDNVVLGFESLYSGLGRRELESCGAGIDQRFVF